MLSERLKIIRKKRKLTQEELAQKINTTKGTISNYENGYSTPSNDMLRDLANALHTKTDYLLGLVDIEDADVEKTEYDSIAEINKLLKKYNIDQSGFFDIEKWKAMGPEGVKQLENYFKFIVQEAEKENKETSSKDK